MRADLAPVTGGSRRSPTTCPPRTPTRCSTPPASWSSPAPSTPTTTSASTGRWVGRGRGDPVLARRRRHHRAVLLPDRPALPEQDRPVRARSCPRSSRPSTGRAAPTTASTSRRWTPRQVGEVPALVGRHGISSFKYYMFYKGFNLSADSRDAKAFTMSDEYDLGHLYQIMEAVVGRRRRDTGRRVSPVAALRAGRADAAVHRAGPGAPATRRRSRRTVRGAGRRSPSGSRSARRPPWPRPPAARSTCCTCPAARPSPPRPRPAARRPGLDMRTEVTLHHLCLNYET